MRDQKQNKTIICSIFFTIFINISYSQVYNVIIKDTNYLKYIREEGTYLYRLKDTLPDGIWNVYFDNNKTKIIYKVKYKNNLRNGVYYEYFDNGNIKIKTRYKNGFLNGKYRGYFKTGILWLKINKYKMNRVDGIWFRYNENGVIVSKDYFKNGVRFKNHFYRNGILIKTIIDKGVNELLKTIEYYPNKKEKIIIDYFENKEWFYTKRYYSENGKMYKLEYYDKNDILLPTQIQK